MAGNQNSGRPTRCTPKLTKSIAAYIEEGIALKTACAAEGVAEVTYYEWMSKGEQGLKPYDHFYEVCTRARALGEIYLHRLGTKGEKGAAQAVWMLERRFRDHYGPQLSKETDKTEIEIRIVGGLPARPTVPEKEPAATEGEAEPSQP